jgi:hypothetical protein
MAIVYHLRHQHHNHHRPSRWDRNYAPETKQQIGLEFAGQCILLSIRTSFRLNAPVVTTILRRRAHASASSFAPSFAPCAAALCDRARDADLVKSHGFECQQVPPLRARSHRSAPCLAAHDAALFALRQRGGAPQMSG